MTTFSLAQTAILSDCFPKPVADNTIADQMVPVAGTTLTTATLGGMQRAMQQNTPVLFKAADGSLQLATLDAERSTPTIPVLKPLYP